MYRKRLILLAWFVLLLLFLGLIFRVWSRRSVPPPRYQVTALDLDGFQPLDLNNSGQILAHHQYEPSILDPSGMIQDVTGFEALAPPLIFSICPNNIDDLGRVYAFELSMYSNDLPVCAYIWSASGGTQLFWSLDGEGQGWIASANNRGTLAGVMLDGQDKSAGFLWNRKQGVKNLGEAIGGSNTITDLNDREEVIGRISGATGGAFLYNATNGTKLLGHLGPHLSTFPSSVNNLGQVVGVSSVTGRVLGAFDGVIRSLSALDIYYLTFWQERPHAFLWEEGNMYDLNDLIPPESDWELTRACAINDQGHIIGTGRLSGVYRSYLLTPDNHR